MKHNTKNILNQMCILLGREDLCVALEAGADYSKEHYLLLECANLAARQIAEEHFPLLRCENKLSDEQCRVFLQDFDKRVHRITHVFSAGAVRETFRTFDEFVKLSRPNYSFEFVYEFEPTRSDFDGDLETASIVSERLLATCAISSFALVCGLFDEAKLWDAKFESAAADLKQKTRGEKRVGGKF